MTISTPIPGKNQNEITEMSKIAIATKTKIMF